MPGTAMGEHFLFNGKHAACYYDDLSEARGRIPPALAAAAAAAGTRRRFPATSSTSTRAARALVRSSGRPRRRLADRIPIVETQAGNVAAYIPTNASISITDGQIFLESDLFYSGVRPAINVGISMSRVGGNAQIRAMRSVAGRLRLDLSPRYRSSKAFAQFGSEQAKTRAALNRGEKMVATLNQPQYAPWPVEEQVVAVFAGTRGYLDDIPTQVPRFQDELREFLRKGSVLRRSASPASSPTSSRSGSRSRSRSSRTPSTSRERRSLVVVVRRPLHAVSHARCGCNAARCRVLSRARSLRLRRSTFLRRCDFAGQAPEPCG